MLKRTSAAVWLTAAGLAVFAAWPAMAEDVPAAASGSAAAPVADSAKAAAPAVPVREARKPVCGATVTAAEANVMPRPEAKQEPVGFFKKGETLRVFGEMGEWLEVSVPEQVAAWVADAKLNADGRATERLKVHAGPSALHPVFGVVEAGETVARVGEVSGDGWQKIGPTPALTGWVRKNQVKLEGGADKLPVSAVAEVAESAGNEPAEAVEAGAAQTEENTSAAKTEGKPPAVAPTVLAPTTTTTTGTAPTPALVPAPAVPAVPATPAASATSPAPATPATPAAAPAVPATGTDAAAAGKIGSVSGNIVNLRAMPGTSYELLAKLKFGDKVQIMGEKGEWLQVPVPAGSPPWVSAKFLDKDGKVVSTQLRVRSGPTINHSDYHMLKRGDTVKKVGEPTKDGWQRIEVPAAAAGWVKKEFVKLDGAEAAAPAVTAKPADAKPGEAPVVTVAVKPADKPADKPVENKPADSAKPADKPAAAPAVAGTVMRPFTVVYEGVVTSLGTKAKDGVFTHLLSVRQGDQMVPVAYLVSPRVALTEWEGRKVKVTDGQEVWYPGWKRPVLSVTGVEAAE